MIEGVGNSTYGFTLEAKRIIDRAINFQERLKHPELSPRHIGAALIGYYKDAFGDRDTQKRVRRALIDWETDNGSTQEELATFYEVASINAGSTKIITRPITELNLLYSLLLPDSQTPPTDPLPFVSGDELYSLVYREKVFKRAGGLVRKIHFGSQPYQVAQEDLRRADTLRRTGWKEFTVIPFGLTGKVS